MQEFHVTINENGRLVIPAPIRKELNIQKGDELVINLSDDNDIRIQTVKNSLKNLQNILTAKKLPLSQELIKMRRNEAKNEE